MKTKRIVITALLLALCIIFQSFKGISVYFTGSAVNAILIIATLSVGMGSGIFIAVMTPIIAWLLGQTPIMQMIPLMIPVVMAGNAVLVFFANQGSEGSLPKWLILGAVFKALVLWLLVWYAVLPFFGAAVPEKIVLTVKATFSITQLITAAIGSAAAYMIHGRIKILYPAGL